MDIYNFIRSKDVATHCRSISKTWNTCEMASIIARSSKTKEEKHKAWQNLIDNYPDMPAIPNKHQIAFDSIHDKLEKIMEHERHLFEQFKKPEPNVSFIYKVWEKGKYHHSKAFFSTYEEATEDAHDNWESFEAPSIVFDKIYPEDAENNQSLIEATFDYDGILHDIDFRSDDNSGFVFFPDIHPDQDEEAILSEGFYVDIPTPFKRGDILTYAKDIRDSGESRIFVLDDLDRDDSEYFARMLKEVNLDGTSLNGYGFFSSRNGILIQDHVFGYDALEYYHGELKEKDGLLHYVNLYYKDEINLPALLTMQCRIMLEHQLKNNLRIDTHDVFIQESLLAENRVSEIEKKELEESGGLMPWVADKLSVHQVEFLMREFSEDKENIQFGLQDGGGSYLGRCAGIIHDENHYARTDNARFNPARKEMAKMILEAYGWTEAGWIDK